MEVAEKVSQHVEYPEDNYLADQLKIVSKLIAGGSRTPVYLVRLNEFDTHDSQVDDNHNEGIHANLLRMLNDGAGNDVFRVWSDDSVQCEQRHGSRCCGPHVLLWQRGKGRNRGV